MAGVERISGPREAQIDALLDPFFQRLTIEGSLDPDSVSDEVLASLGRLRSSAKGLAANSRLERYDLAKWPILKGPEFTVDPTDLRVNSLRGGDIILTVQGFKFMYGLMLGNGHGISTDLLTGILWPDGQELDDILMSLRSCATRVRREVDHPGTNIFYAGRGYNSHIIKVAKTAYKLLSCPPPP